MASSGFEHIHDEEFIYVESLQFFIGLFTGIFPFGVSIALLLCNDQSMNVNPNTLIIVGLSGLAVFISTLIWFKKDKKKYDTH